MPIVFFYGSGSPDAWKVWLALEHKQLSYELRVLSFQAGEMRKSDFLRINPRGKVPALLDADPSEISAARDALVPELAWAERICADGLTVREPSAADYAIYPWLAMLSRLEERQSHHGFRLPESLRLYMAAIE